MSRKTNYLLLILLLVGVLATACAHSSNGSKGSRDSSQSGLGSLAVARYFFISSSDFQNALPLTNFLMSINNKSMNTCLRQHGFTAQYPYTPQTYDYSIGNSLFPDLDRIKSEGILPLSDLKGFKDWVPNIPREQRNAFKTTARSCEGSEDANTVRLFDKPWDALREEWRNIDVRGDADPRYVRLESEFATCVSKRGYQGKTPVEYLGGIDGLLMGASSISEKTSISLRTGKVYAECYGAANAYRQKIREKARAKFLDQHALAIQDAQRKMEESIVRLTKKFDVELATTHKDS